MWLTVEAAEKGLSLKRFLAARFPGLSQFYLQGRVHQGLCTVDGAPGEWGRKLRGGEKVEIDVDLEAQNSRRPENIALEIVFEDGERLVVNKPAGMLVHPSKHIKSGTLANAVAHHLSGKPFWFVHRLDRETSGVLVISKSPQVTSHLAKLWASRQVQKQYAAILAGAMALGPLRVEAPIGRREGVRPQWGITEQGRPALTLGEVKAVNGDWSWVELEPVTGRTNQLRIHCASLGHPVVGDLQYGGPPADRMYLHCRELVVDGQVYNAPERDFPKPLPAT